MHDPSSTGRLHSVPWRQQQPFRVGDADFAAQPQPPPPVALALASSAQHALDPLGAAPPQQPEGMGWTSLVVSAVVAWFVSDIANCSLVLRSERGLRL
jgi:hypothetical protein